MRIDLLLKSLCLVKTRSQAHKGCEAGCISVNGKRAKPAAEIRAGDVIELRYPRRVLAIEVLEIPGGQVPRRDRGRHYRVVREHDLEGGGDWDE